MSSSLNSSFLIGSLEVATGSESVDSVVFELDIKLSCPYARNAICCNSSLNSLSAKTVS